MAKKKPKKPVKKPAPKHSPAKSAAKPTPPPPPGSEALVLYELRDQAGMVRYHSDHADLNRARGTAMMLANSPDVGQCWIVQNVEVVRRQV
ncbi:MAG: hypothetical protein SFU86_09985 [Pirellulaceae bacterium]|nr:hypothetical protein [Pirellulaceae bacterium]